MSKVKICGITNQTDAAYASQIGSDYIGIIFSPESKRYVSEVTAKEIRRAINPTSKLVGVFKDQEVSFVNNIADELDLDYIQLHGKESQEYIYTVERPVIKVLEYNLDSLDIERLVKKAKDYNFCSHILLDKPKTQKIKNSKAINIEKLSALVSAFKSIHPGLMLAGGVDSALAKSFDKKHKPYAFDICSSLEKRHGIKDHNLMAEFVSSIKSQLN